MPFRTRFARLLAVTLALLLVLPSLAMAASITGEVLDGQNGAPLAGMYVRAYSYDPGGEPQERSASGETTTTADGSFSMTGLAEGYYTLVFSDPNDVYRDQVYPGWGIPPVYAPSYYASDEETLVADQPMFKKSYLNANRVKRVAGSDIYQSAIQASKKGFYRSKTVVIVGGAGWADALSASTLSGYYNAPILFTPSRGVPRGLIAEAKRLGARKAIIVGGPASVSSRVVSQLKSGGVSSVSRLYGRDRYSTSLAVVKHLVARDAVDSLPFVVNGDAWADAVSVAPLAYSDGMPVLLVKPGSVPAATAAAARAIGMKQAIIMGGTRSIGTGAMNGLARIAGGRLSYLRISGADRYAVSAQLAKIVAPRDYVALANGSTFHQAFAGGIVAGNAAGVMLLTPATSLHAGARSVISANRMYLWEVTGFGTSSQLSYGVLSSARRAVGNSFLELDDEVQMTALGQLQAAARSRSLKAAMKDMPLETAYAK